MAKSPAIKRNIWLFYIINFLSNFWFFTPVAALFFVQVGGSAKAAMLAVAVKSVTSAVLEVPTGTLGDRVGRKITLILSGVFAVVACALWAVSYSLPLLLVASFIVGVSDALSSGTGQAMLYDSIVQAGREKEFKKINGWMTTAFPIAAGLSAFLGGVIAEYSIRLTFTLSLIPASLFLISMFFLIEPHFHKKADATFVGHTKESILAILRSRVLLLLTAIGVIGWAVGFMTLSSVLPLLYEEVGMPLFFFGIFAALTQVGMTVGLLSSHYVAEWLGERLLIVPGYALGIAAWVSATTLEGVWVGVPIVFALFLMGLRIPIIEHIAQRNIPTERRATIISFKMLINSIARALGSLVIGVLIDAFSAAFAIRVMVIVLIVNLIFLAQLPTSSEKTNS